MSDLKVQPPKEKSRFLTPQKYGGFGRTAWRKARNARLRLARRAQARPSTGGQALRNSNGEKLPADTGTRDDNAAAREVGRLLFLLCCLSLFGGWGNDVLEPHVGDKIAVVFHVVRVVNVEH